MIKYQYAKNEDGQLIEINSLNETNKKIKKYFCVGCGNELIPRLGNVKIHHFAHKKVVTCSSETYLHLLGKQLFYDNYIKCLKYQKPFYIEIYQEKMCNHFEKDFGLKCKLNKSFTCFDLTKHFNKISIEAREGSFIADIMLTSNSGKDKMFIEIAVTHLSSETKLNSNYRIIEIVIENEEDFEPIKKNILSVNESKIKFKNFKTREITTSICNGNCKKEFNFFTLDKDGRCLLKQKNLKQIKNYLAIKNDNIVRYKITKDEGYYPDIFKRGVATFAKENLNVRNCFICRYHAKNNSFIYIDSTGTPIFCKFLKIKCNSNQAVTCEYFKIETKYIEELNKTVQQIELEPLEYYNLELDENAD